MIEGVDFSWGRPGGKALAAAGKKFVVRYVPYAGAGGKGLSKSEIAEYKANGLSIALVYESTANRALSGRAAGIVDARTSEAALKALGLPRLPIYFAVDFDANAAHQVKVDDYLRGAASILGSNRIGVYGGYNVIQRCKVNRTATWFWQTYAWSYGRIASGIHLYQYRNGQKINGAWVDLCRAYKADYGQLPTPPPTSTDPPPVTPPKPPAADPYGNPNQPGSMEYVVWMHEHGYKMLNGKWVKEKPPVTPPPVDPPPVTPPPADPPPVTPPANPHEPGSMEYFIWMHDHGYKMLNGKWVKEDRPIYEPDPPPISTKPTFPALPVKIETQGGPYDWVDWTSIRLGAYDGARIGTSGTAFVLIHGGPQPVGKWGDLLSLGQRLAGKGAQAFCIDYAAFNQVGEVDWRISVADITIAVTDIRRLLKPTERVVLVAHSYGGFPTSIACLRDGVGDAYAAVNAISSTSGVGGVIPLPLPDPVSLARLSRLTMPIAVIRGERDIVASADNKAAFAAAVAEGKHPGYHTMDGGDHTATLFMDATTDTLIALAKLI